MATRGAPEYRVEALGAEEIRPAAMREEIADIERAGDVWEAFAVEVEDRGMPGPNGKRYGHGYFTAGVVLHDVTQGRVGVWPAGDPGSAADAVQWFDVPDDGLHGFFQRWVGGG